LAIWYVKGSLKLSSGIFDSLTILFILLQIRISVSTRDDGNFCQNLNDTGALEGSTKDFCSPDPIHSYLRVYAISIGDFSLDDFEGAYLMYTILAVGWTLIGVVIMLNVLIAVLSDSYEKAKISSVGLFGRARVNFVTQNQALESFLLPKSGETNINLQSRIFRCLILMSLVGSAMWAEVMLGAAFVKGLWNGMYLFYLIIIFAALAVLSPALLILVIFSFGVFENFLPNSLKGPLSKTEKLNDYIVSGLSQIFGFDDAYAVSSAADEEGAGDEWLGAVVHIERAFQRTALRTRNETKNEIHQFEKRLYEKLLDETSFDYFS
jgi:hypothetical protein